MTNQDNYFDVRRVAMHVAIGEISLPHDFSREQLQAVVREVGVYRRNRLIKHIARAIAQDIHCSDNQHHKER